MWAVVAETFLLPYFRIANCIWTDNFSTEFKGLGWSLSLMRENAKDWDVSPDWSGTLVANTKSYIWNSTQAQTFMNNLYLRERGVKIIQQVKVIWVNDQRGHQILPSSKGWLTQWHYTTLLWFQQKVLNELDIQAHRLLFHITAKQESRCRQRLRCAHNPVRNYICFHNQTVSTKLFMTACLCLLKLCNNGHIRWADEATWSFFFLNMPKEISKLWCLGLTKNSGSLGPTEATAASQEQNWSTGAVWIQCEQLNCSVEHRQSCDRGVKSLNTLLQMTPTQEEQDKLHSVCPLKTSLNQDIFFEVKDTKQVNILNLFMCSLLSCHYYKFVCFLFFF